MKKYEIFLLLFSVLALFAAMPAPDAGITPLMKACAEGDVNEVERLIKAGADVNVKTTVCEVTVLEFALENEHPLAIIRALLSNGADAKKPQLFLSKVISACRRWNSSNERTAEMEQVVHLLLDMPVEWNLDFALSMSLSYQQSLDISKRLLKLGASPNFRCYPSALIGAINYDDSGSTEALELLFKYGADPNLAGAFGGLPVSHVRNKKQFDLFLRHGRRLDGLKNLDLLARWVDLETLDLLIGKGVKITANCFVEAARNPNLPEIFDRMTKESADAPPLDKMQTQAIKQGPLGNIKFLAAKGEKPDVANLNLLYSALLWQQNSPETLGKVDYFIEQGARINEPFSWPGNDYKRTLLGQTIGWNNLKTVKYLLERGADPNVGDQNGKTALFYLLGGPPHSTTGPRNKLETLNLLAEHGLDVKRKDRFGMPVLVIAMITNTPDEVIRRLVELGADVNAATNEGITPLMLAAMTGKAGIVDYLIGKGADINARDITGWTPLFYASHKFGYHSYWQLDREIPQPEIEKNAGIIASLLRHNAAGNTLDEFGASALIGAAAWADRDTLKLMLAAGGKRLIHARNQYHINAIINAAAFNNDLAAIRLLLNAGADANSVVKNGKPQQRNMMAHGFGPSEMRVTLTVAEGQYTMGWRTCPLFSAVHRDKPELLKLLLEYGADPQVKYDSENALSFWVPSAEIEKILLAAGVRYEDNKKGEKYPNIRWFNNKLRDLIFAEQKPFYERLPVLDKQSTTEMFGKKFEEALHNGTFEEVKFFGEKLDDFEASLISRAASNPAYPEVVKWFVTKKPDSLNYQDSLSRTVLHYARHPGTVEFLVKQGLDVNRQDKEGKTPLVCLLANSAWGKGDMVEALIRHGADINIADHAGNTAMSLLTDKPERRRSSPFDYPRPGQIVYNYFGSYEIDIIRMLVKHGANINAPVNGKTPLEKSILADDMQFFENLISLGADVRKIDMSLLKPEQEYVLHRINELKK